MHPLQWACITDSNGTIKFTIYASLNNWPGGSTNEGADVYVIDWPPSGSTGLQDLLVFNIKLLGKTDNDQAVLELDFNRKASRAAGVVLDDLLSGKAVIEDQCVLETLEDFQEEDPRVEFRVGGPGGEPFDFSGGSSGGGELCSKILCATVCSVDGSGNRNCSCQYEFAVLVPCGL